MKLVFPGGEHPQVLLSQGINRIGSDPDGTIVLNHPGISPQHCQLRVSAHGVMLDVPRGMSVTVNGHQIDGLIALRPGDDVTFDGVQARLSGMDAVAAILHEAGAPESQRPSANDDPGVTAVRQVLPRFLIRGVSGEVFGRSVPLHGVTTIGRSQDCNLHMDDPGLSRHHARLLPAQGSVLVEDLGSSNGTFINGKRVLRGEARAGDEIGFDTLRFHLVASFQAESTGVAEPLPLARRSSRHWLALAAFAVAAIACIAALSWTR